MIRQALTALLLVASASACAQLTVTDAPPKIAFDPWKEVSRTEASVEYQVAFPSAIESPYPVNNTVPLQVFVPANREAPVPVVLILHYLGARDLRVEQSLATFLNERNVAAAILTLPYHLKRCPPGKRSGELAVPPDPQGLVASMTQCVLDARRSMDFLASRPEFDPTRIGIVGTSLGSIVATLTYALDDRPSAAGFVLGGIDLAKILWTSSRVVAERDVLRRKGYTEEKLRAAIASIEPGKYLPSRAATPTFVVAAKYDTVVPPATTQALIQALPDPRVLSLDTGHYGGVLVQRRLLREISGFFADEFSSKRYVPPKLVFIPTLRLAVTATTESGFDVAGGLDLIRPRVPGVPFVSLLISPRKPRLFVGWQLDKGLSFGAFGSPKRISFGVMWSTAL